MDNSRTTITVAPAVRGRWRRRIIGKPVGDIITEITVFVMGVAVLYSVDFFIISRSAPVALHYLIDVVVYLNHHAAAAIETFN